MKKRAFYKDILRTLKNNLSRFIALVVMTALGTGVFTGFAAGCMDVFDSADLFYDKQNTYDIKIASTLGLTNDDLSAVSKLKNVNSVFGNSSMDVMVTQKDGNQLLANVTTLDTAGMNNPYVEKGTLPNKSGQIAVTSKFIRDTGLKIGDRITLEEADDTEGDDTTETTPVELENSESDLGISIESDSPTPSLEASVYEITAIILSPLNISNTEGSIAAMSFSSSSTDYPIYVTRECIKGDIYSALYITLDGTATMDCFSSEYQTLVEHMTNTIEETIQKGRQQARYDEVVGAANSKITEAEQLLANKIAETDQKLLDAQTEIDDGWDDFKEGQAEIQINKTKLMDGQQALNDAQKSADKKFIAAQKELDDNLAELNSGEKKLNEQETTTNEKFATYEQQLTNNRKELNTQKSEADLQLSGAVAGLSKVSQEIWNSEAAKQVWADMIADGVNAAPYLLAGKQGDTPTEEQTESYHTAMTKLQSDTQALALSFATNDSPLTEEQINVFSTLAVTYGTLNYSQITLDKNEKALATQKSDALKQISKARKKIENGKTQIIDGQKELDKNKTEAIQQFADKQTELDDGLLKIKAADKKLTSAAAKLTDGQAELDENKSEYENSIASARQQLNNAKEDVANISMAKWYVWDRSENDSFTGLNNDISFIEAVTKAFPIIFFLVAILVCLTTMTRMVEEDRALIGTYKSLGYSKFQISLKYILYAMLACVIGGILGNVIGFLALPKVIAIIMSSMYIVPTFHLSFYPFYGLLGFGLFLLGIIGATIIACIEMLRKRPAELMRPKSPKEGNRIFLERFPFIWKRLKFLNKVTCRNLFRYKKRAAMTIVGILGCMMLIVLGFGVRDTVGGLMPDQFNKVTVYDAIVVTDNLNTDEMNQFDNELNTSGKVEDKLHLQITTMTLLSNRDNIDITVMVIPDGADLKSFIHLKNIVTNKKMSLPTEGIVVTQNAAKQLKLKRNDIISLQNEDNLEAEFPIAYVTANYAGNYVYISESCYQEAFGDYAETALLLNLKDQSQGQTWLDKLSEDDRILTVSSSQAAKDTFGDVMKLINMVVYLLISMSAVLALTVLFTLSNINVSERERELATMKVLGFKPKEVNSYVNKETLILTLLGILLGMPAGYGITYVILGNVSIADTSFIVRVSIAAYLIAAMLTLIFTLVVNKFTNKALHRINMVEALKSVE